MPLAVANRETSIATLLVNHFERVWRFARRMGLDAALAEEAAQEAFLLLSQRLDRVGPGKELSYLLSSVTLISRNLRRKASHRREHAYDPADMENHFDGSSGHEEIAQHQAKQLVDELLSELSEPLRVVLVLYELEQMTLQEIANHLEIPLGTAGSRLRLGRKAFAEAARRFEEAERFTGRRSLKEAP
jgi:RNA polymerase sigma-70 factor (ECF subfamily)